MKMREGRYAWILTAVLVTALAGCCDSDTPLGVAEGGAAGPAGVNLGTAGNFGVLAGAAVNNTGATTVDGDLGAGTTVTGFPPGTVAGATHTNDATTIQAQLDLTSAFNDLAGRTDSVFTIPSGGLAGLLIGPGVYHAGSLTNSGTVTLNALGDTTAVFIFQSNTTLTSDPDSRVVLTNGARAENVYWVVGTTVNLGSNSEWVGNILADQSITLNSGATLNGRALSRTGSVTLDTNVITLP
jgi:hypothetical protein